MLWNPQDFHPLAFAVLQRQAHKLLPLTAREFQPQDLPSDLMSIPAEELFPRARDARAALSGLLLLASHWEASHRVSQSIATREGSYWHAIAHRIEPDCANAAYWFDRVGEHPIFPAVREECSALLSSAKVNWQIQSAKSADARRQSKKELTTPLGGAPDSATVLRELLKRNWDTKLFADWCNEARSVPGTEEYRLACAMQQAECNQLLAWCALKTKDF